MTPPLRTRFQADTLRDTDPAATDGGPGKAKAKAFVESFGPYLQEQQTRLYAGHQRSVLLLLQGMDGCGKDGAVKHVIGLFFPTSVQVAAFKTPTEEEQQHDFLWRFRPHLPAPGTIGVFNRSWYEDVGVAKVHGLAAPDVIEERYGLINAFEREVSGAGTVLLKVFLHLSYEEQGRRMLARLADPSKRWKFHQADLRERESWADYMAAYDTAIARCSDIPWHVVPADHKWYRDWVLVQLIAETLEELHLEYPARPDLNIEALTQRLKDS